MLTPSKKRQEYTPRDVNEYSEREYHRFAHAGCADAQQKQEA
jgi:hypothetical protein